MSDIAVTKPSVLIVGIGSSHGDDQLGWIVVQEVVARLQRRREAGGEAIDGRWEVQRAASPADLLDWLPGPSRLILVDACESLNGATPWRCLAGDDLAASSTRGATGHLIALPAVLDVARNLGHLPERVEIWAIRGDDFSPGSSPSVESVVRARELATAIEREL